jgi:hypothetical protein
LLVSCLSGTISNSAWFVDSGASRHMTGTHELFTCFSEKDLDLHVELGTNAKCGVEGVGTVRFQLESGGSLEVADVLHVPELKMNLLSVLAMEDGQVLIWSKGSDLDSARVLGVKEGNVYRLQGKPVSGSKGVLDHGSMSVVEDEEQEAPKGTQCLETSSVGSQPSARKEELAHSRYVRKPSWYELTLMDS